MWLCTHTPASQPGFVHCVPSVSVQRGSVWLSFSAPHCPVFDLHSWHAGQLGGGM
jgi:hypothetical protein